MRYYLRIIFFLSALIVLLKYVFVWGVFGEEYEPENLYYYKGEVISVYDGDTVRADIDLGMNIWIRNASVRLYGIDTPEIRGIERPKGIRARDRLKELLKDRTTIFRTYKDKTGKFGRYLVEIFVIEDDGSLTNINEQLVKEGHAVFYMKK